MIQVIIDPPARVDDFKPRYRLPGPIEVSASTVIAGAGFCHGSKDCGLTVANGREKK